MKVNQRNNVRISSLVTLALIVLLGCSQAAAQWTTSSNSANNINNTNSGNVGIGTNAPDVKLQVHHSSSNTNTANMQLPDLSFAFRNTSNTNGNMSLISFQDSAGWGTAQIGAIQLSQTSHVGELVFFTKGIGSSTERMRIRSDGRIGIGTPAPGFQLDVQGGRINASGGLCINGDCKTAWSEVGGSGVSTTSAANISSGQFGQNTGGGNYTFPANVVVNGTINAKYQDVAEWVPAEHALPAGTVVVLNPTQSNQVIASAQAYDTRVAGVISETPGLALGESGTGKVLVATTGRVRVKVDATRGPIAIGDLLVTSDIQGVAMKSVPVEVGGVQIHRPGTLIGKALEPLAKGKGEILVLLSMQ